MLTELSALHPLAQLVLKASVLLLATTGATALLRNRSAALRHLIWLCCAIGLLVLPPLTLTLPSVPLPFAGPATEEPIGAASEAVRTESTTEPAPEKASSGSPSLHQQANALTANPAPTRKTSALPLAAIWFAGTALLLLWRLAGDRYLSKVLHRCRPVEPYQQAASVLAECAAALGVKRPALLTSGVAPLPFACGPFRAVIVLPEAALDWDSEKLRPVLMHEMAHVKRRDCLTHFVAHCARALFWFHPLAWWMTRQLHLEREIACDDMVLQAGHEPSRYGKVLLRLATEIDSPGYLPTGAIAMAGKSTLERRLRALLDPLRNRHGLSRKKLGAALGLTVLLAVSPAVLQVSRQGADANSGLANQPHKLRSLPTERVIRIGISELESPWPWQELRERAEQGKLTGPEAESLLTALTVSMRQYPGGYDKPLNWLRELLRKLQARQLIPEAKMIEFIQAYHGSPAMPQLPRLLETDKTLPLVVEWQSVWEQELFGFVLLNEMKSITIDSQPVEFRSLYQPMRKPEFHGEVQLPPLTPGSHRLRCEILSAFVAKADMAGLADDAPSDNWPPARLKWTRTVEAEFMVYKEDATIVRLTQDPALDPRVTGGLSVEKIIIRRARRGPQAAVALKLSDSLNVPIGFDVALRVAGRTYKLGQLWRGTTQTRSGKGISYSGTELSAQIDALPLDIRTADIVLTPNPRVVERFPAVDQIWGKEIVLEQISLARHDMLQVSGAAAQPE